MTWTGRNGIVVWTGAPLDEPTDRELSAYAFCAVPVSERPSPSCGRPGTGRDRHNRRGEPTCALCVTAERLYKRSRRANDDDDEAEPLEREDVVA